MSTLDAQLRAHVDAARRGDAGAHEGIFHAIEEAALANLGQTVAQVEAVMLGLDPDDALRIPCLKGLAHALCYENRFEEALEHLRQAHVVAMRTGRDEDSASLQLTMVQPLERLGHIEQAEACARSALAAFMARRDAHNVGRAMVNLGVVRRVRGDAAEALEWFERARPQLEGRPLAQATVDTNAAEALLDLDRFEEAGQAFARARDSFDEHGHVLGGAIAQGNLADLASRLGRIDEAVVTYEDARRRFAMAGSDADAARLLAEEADVYAAAGAYARAARLYEQALPGLDVPGLRIERSRTLLGLGRALLGLGALERAHDVLARAVEATRGGDAATTHQDALIALGEVHEALGDRAGAAATLDALGDALALRPVRRAGVLLLRARLCGLVGDAEGARALIQLASATPGARALPWLRAALDHAQARTCMQAGRYEEAWEHLHCAMDAAERARAQTSSHVLRATSLEAMRDMYADAVRVAREASPDRAGERVFMAVERLRARSLADACAGRILDGVQTVGGGPAQALRERLQAAYGDLSRDRGDGARLMDKIRALEGQLEVLEGREVSGIRPAGALGPVHISQARAALGHDECLVQFHTGPDGLGALVIAPSGVRMVRGVLTADRCAQLQRRQALAVDMATLGGGTCGTRVPASNPGYDALRDAFAGPLARAIAELAPGCDWVMMVPSREVHGLAAAPALAEVLGRSRVWLAPSVTTALAVRERARAIQPRVTNRQCSMLSVGVADALAPGMDDEAEHAGACYGDATVLTHGRANSGAFLEALREHDVVHVAAHCEFDSEFPMASRLRLADRWVAARELVGAMRPGCVVVLAGCESGRSSQTTGEDRFGLVRALLAGGASMVVASYWRLDDRAAAWMFPRLHRAIADSREGAVRGAVRGLDDVQRQAREAGLAWHAWQALFAKGGLS